MQAKVFKLIERIGNLLRSEARKKYAAVGLQPVHGQVLEYLATCNRFSDTPAAVAEFLGLTKGTVSQTIQVLERRGYVAKTADADDGRVVHLALSAEGADFLAGVRSDRVLEQVLRQVEGQGLPTLEAGLTAVLAGLQQANNARSFGVCHSCVNFGRKDGQYHCKLTDLPLTVQDADKICREHEPPDNARTAAHVDS